MTHSPLIFPGVASEIDGSFGGVGAAASLKERVDVAAGASIVIVELIAIGVGKQGESGKKENKVQFQ